METNVNYTIVGIFVIFLTAAIILAIIWLSSGFSFAIYNTYKIEMQESVSGLSIDSVVEYNGVIVGHVKSIQLNHLNPHLVDLLIEIKSDTPITRATVATLTTRGITGGVFLSLKDRGNDRRSVVILPGETYPIIPTTPSIFVRLDTALTQMNTSFKQISDSIRSLLDTENLAEIKSTLANLKQASQNLIPVIKSMKPVIESFKPLIQSGTTTVKTFETQIMPSANQLLFNLNDAAQNLSTVTTEIKQNPSILIRGKAPAKPGPGE